MAELVDDGILPLFERRIEQHAESVLKWSRNNVSESKIHDVPENLKREIRPSLRLGRDFLLPSFLTGERYGTGLLAVNSGMISEEVAMEIVHRQEDAKKNIEVENAKEQIAERASRVANRRVEERVRPEEFRRRKEEPRRRPEIR